MVNSITRALEEFETLVSEGEIASFWVSVRSQGLWIQATHNSVERLVPLEQDMFHSLGTFFYGVDRIDYRSQDYTNLKSFVNTRAMLDRLLSKEDGSSEPV